MLLCNLIVALQKNTYLNQFIAGFTLFMKSFKIWKSVEDFQP